MTVYDINANLTIIIMKAQSNVGNFSKTGGAEKVSTEHPQKMHLWMDTFTSIVLLNVETVLLALINVLKNLLGHKNKPKPPLSWSDRGPTGDSNKKRVP